jgi:hypothetical protein
MYNRFGERVREGIGWIGDLGTGNGSPGSLQGPEDSSGNTLPDYQPGNGKGKGKQEEGTSESTVTGQTATDTTVSDSTIITDTVASDQQILTDKCKSSFGYWIPDEDGQLIITDSRLIGMTGYSREHIYEIESGRTGKPKRKKSSGYLQS